MSPKGIAKWSLEKRKILAIKLVLCLVQLAVSLLLVLFNKICHPYSHLFNHLSGKGVIKHQDDKLFREIMEEMLENCRNSAKLRENRETG